ncbi:hypothetical protein EW146_g7398 [Bondarzewia mesenterica]|uniref:Uncharacterized protein n=1 Tax=Bondarzewia mesenterica TaxID=1095465 RepID=A0A4S4LLH2_9AGAM|nr:hypothetical protein EW146_g7398 [Bondarzewia mesenterica]
MSSVRSGRPRNVGGLPSHPRARSVGRDREVGDPISGYPNRSSQPPTSYSRQVRPQHSLANLPSHSHTASYSDPRGASRARAPPLPPYGRNPREMSWEPQAGQGRGQYDKSYGRRSDSSSPASSPISEVSSGSSFLDRMKNKPGDTSSRTSLEEDPVTPKRARGGWLKDAGSRLEEAAPATRNDPEIVKLDPSAGHGASLWSRVADAASNLTVSVGQAWSYNVQVYSGEQTPPGQESRLTRAMKAYHLEKARDPSDLPEWLFDESERRAAGGRGSVNRRDDREENYGREEPSSLPQRSRGLRDIYDAAAAAPSGSYARSDSGGYRSRTTSPTNDGGLGASKAGDRLKALRDAKRNAAQRNTSSTPNRGDKHDRAQRRERDSRDNGYVEHGRGGEERGPEPRRSPPRMGLPSRPGRAPQRF